MHGYKIEQDEPVIFEHKTDYVKAITELKKQGFLKLTKGFYYNKNTKQCLRTSEIYYL